MTGNYSTGAYMFSVRSFVSGAAFYGGVGALLCAVAAETFIRPLVHPQGSVSLWAIGEAWQFSDHHPTLTGLGSLAVLAILLAVTAAKNIRQRAVDRTTRDEKPHINWWGVTAVVLTIIAASITTTMWRNGLTMTDLLSPIFRLYDFITQ
jgi:hypothetical protein